MNVAIISDMHGNRDALSAVLADIDSQNVDQIICAGDIVNKGPYPAECLQMIREQHIPAVMGNTDQDVLNKDEDVDKWVYDRLSADEVAHLRSLPLQYRLTPKDGQSPQDDLLVVHSTPRSCYDLLVCEPHPNPITQTDGMTRITPEEEALAMLNGERANLIVYGHIHYTSYRVIGGQRVASIGAVGLPLDGDQRAAYALAQWDGSNWQLAHKRVAYNVENVIQDVQKSNMPTKERVAQMLQNARWVRGVPQN